MPDVSSLCFLRCQALIINCCFRTFWRSVSNDVVWLQHVSKAGGNGRSVEGTANTSFGACVALCVLRRSFLRSLVSFSQVLEHTHVQCPHVSSFQLLSSEKLEVLLHCHTKFSTCQRSVQSCVLLSSERKLSFWHIRSVNVTQLLLSLLLVLLVECVKLLRLLFLQETKLLHL